MFEIKSNKNKKKTNQKRQKNIMPFVRFGVVGSGIAFVLIIFFLAILYLLQTSQTAKYGYEIEKYDRIITELKEEKSKLESEAARIRSTNEIKGNLEKLNMQQVDPTKITYYDIKKHLANLNHDSKIKQE